MPSIKKSMNVNSHCKSISNSIFTVILEWFNVSCFKYFWHFSICDYATSTSCQNISSEMRLIWAAYSLPNSLTFHFANDLTLTHNLKHTVYIVSFIVSRNNLIDFINKFMVDTVMLKGIALIFMLKQISVIC